MIAKTDPYIGKAYEELLRISADEEKRLEYEARQKAILDHNYLMRINEEKGKEEGRAEEIVETGYEFDFSENDILERLQNKLNVSLQQAQEYFNMFKKQSL